MSEPLKKLDQWLRESGEYECRVWKLSGYVGEDGDPGVECELIVGSTYATSGGRYEPTVELAVAKSVDAALAAFEEQEKGRGT